MPKIWLLKRGYTPVTSTSRFGSMRPEFGRTQYLKERTETPRQHTIFFLAYERGMRPDILLRCCSLDLESNGCRVRVLDLQGLGDLNSERAYPHKISVSSNDTSAQYSTNHSLGEDERRKPSSAGSIATDMTVTRRGVVGQGTTM